MKRYISLLLFFMPLMVISGQGMKTSEVNKSSGTNPRDEALNVFLDCRWCDRNYIKQTIPYVNYVNNKDEADVHVLVRRRRTGGGGGEYTINFIGQGDFMNIDDEIMFFSPINETADETRRARSNTIAMGLMKFVARTPLSRNIHISYKEDGGSNENVRRLKGNIEDDPWNSWMFRVGGSGEFRKDQNYETTQFRSNFDADRITPELKLQFDADYSYRQTIYESNSIKSFRENWSLKGMAVKSLDSHWSLGGRINLSSDTYNNYNLAVNAGPAIEYNLFPYEESFSRQLRIQYGVNGHYNNYIDTTTYFKTEETLLKHYLSASLGFNQPSGSGYVSLTWSNYLHDFSQNNLGFRARINYRIYKGLSVNFSSRANLIHDQRNLAKGSATEQEVLTRQRALETNYSYSLEMGISYSFGSIYNNVVNPRFGN